MVIRWSICLGVASLMRPLLWVGWYEPSLSISWASKLGYPNATRVSLTLLCLKIGSPCCWDSSESIGWIYWIGTGLHLLGNPKSGSQGEGPHILQGMYGPILGARALNAVSHTLQNGPYKSLHTTMLTNYFCEYSETCLNVYGQESPQLYTFRQVYI